MSARRGILAGPILPAILCMALGAALYRQLDQPPEQSIDAGVTAAAGGPGPGAAVSDPFELPPVAAFSEIVGRPVFSPTRRPPDGFEPEPGVAEVAPSRVEMLDLTIVGIITGPRELALLRSPSSDRLLPMAEGDELSGWTLIEIEPFRLVFRRDDDERMFEMEYRDD